MAKTVEERILEQYPTLAFLINDPEVGPLLREAVDPDKGFSPTVFQSRLYETDWFKSRSVSQRQWEILSHTDPGEAQRQINEYATNIMMRAKTLGVNVSNAEAKFMAGSYLSTGTTIDSSEFNATFSQWVRARPSDRTKGIGDIDAAQSTIDSMRSQYYLPDMSPRVRKQTAIGLAFGQITQQALQAQFQEKAIQQYHHLRDELESGLTMQDIFAGHQQIIAEELELSPTQIDFTRPKWEKVISTADAETGKPRMMTLSEVRRLARSQDEWWDTSRGRESDAGMANFLLDTFGMRKF